MAESDMSGAPKSWTSMAPQLGRLITAETLPKLRDAFGKIDDTLFNLSETGSAVHLDALRVVRNSRQSLLNAWPEHVQVVTMRWGQPVNTSSTIELSLVGHDELEERLAVDQMAETFYKHNSVLFNALDPVWIAFPNAADVAAPLDPKGFACLLCEWLATLAIDADDRVVVLKIMEREVVSCLPSLLNAAIELFKDNGFKVGATTAPKIERVAREIGGSSDGDGMRGMGGAGTGHPGHLGQEWNNEQVAAHMPQQLSSLLHPHYPPVAYRPSVAAGQRLSGQAAHDLAVAFQHLMNMDPSHGAVPEVGLPVQGSVAPEGGEQEYDPILADLVHMLHRRRVAHQADRTLLDKPVIGSETLRNVLNNMQKDLPSSVRQAARQNDQTLAQQFKDAMLQQAVLTGSAPRNSKLNDQDEDAVDIVGMLFEIFLTERQITDEMRENIARLLAPYVKVAINDRKMFMHKSHPARKFLDILAEACEGNAGVSNHEKTTLAKVTHSIDQLSREFNEDVAIFELIESEIRQFIDQQRASIDLAERRAAETQRGKERLEHAKKTAIDTFSEKTSDCNWPVKTLDLIRNYWCQHHMLLLLKQENHNDNNHLVIQSINLLDNMIRVGNMGAVQNKDIISTLHQDMVHMLASSGVIDETAHTVATDIWNALDQASIWTSMISKGIQPTIEPQVTIKHPTVFSEATATSEKPGVTESDVKHSEKLREELEERNKNTPADEVANQEIPVGTQRRVLVTDQEIIEYFKTMEIGTWVDFVKPNGEVVNTKFSWASPISNRLLFVTQRGTRHAVESAEDLAMMVRLERVRLRDVGVGERGFDHSYQRAIAQLQDQIPATATTQSQG